LSELARFGSGSASRSVFGGLVKWKGVPKEFSLKKKICDEQELENLSK
jgi:mevalonate pyrophosphate decarboxylase